MIDNLVLDIGKQEWNVKEDGPWVRKIDVTQFERCRYKVYVNHHEGMRYEDFLTPDARNFFIDSGIQFEAEVVEEALEQGELRVDSSIEDARKQEGLVTVPLTIRNHDLGIVGRLDMMMVEGKRLIPVEAKNHTRFTSLDETELAFYWRLLEPIQWGRRDRNRKGYVKLNSGDMEEVALTKDDFIHLNDMIERVRTAKRWEPRLRPVRECDYCVFKDAHLPQIYKARDVKLISGVGPARRRHLEQLGINTVEQLAEADTSELSDKLSQVSRRVPNTVELRRMQAHAKVFVTNQPQVIGRRPIPELSKALLLDLEYFPEHPRQVFVAGVLVVEAGDEADIHIEFADSADDEGVVLTSLTALLENFPKHSVITWNGSMADIPALRDAWSRLGLSKGSFRDIEERHIDLLPIARSNIRLPIRGFGLKNVSSYFGFERAHPDIHSMFIPMKYVEYLRTNQQGL